MKEQFLGMLKEQVKQESVKDIAEGRLSSPVNLDEVCGRLIPALRRNVITKMSLKTFGITDEDLRQMFREIAEELDLEVK